MKLRLRIAAVLMLVTVLLCLLFSGAIVSTGYDVEDRLLEHRLQLSISDFVAEWQVDSTAEPRHERTIQAWVGLANVPERYQAVFGSLPPGMHEWQHETTLADQASPDGKDRLLAVVTLDKDVTAYFVYDTGLFEDEAFASRQILPLLTGSLLGVLLVLVVAWVLVDRWVVRRLQSLGRNLDDALPQADEPASSFTTTAKPAGVDEVDHLAKQIQAYRQRIDGFLQREQRLTRDVSHELRTPITVIQGALDLLEQQQHSPQATRPLQRMRRATETMSMLVQAFLVTAREEQEPDQLCDLQVLVHQRCEALQPLAEAEGKQFLLSDMQAVKRQVFAAPVAVILDNLLRNAIDHSCSSAIVVKLNESSLQVQNEVADALPGDVLTDGHRRSGSSGYGYGLGIAAEFASRLNWRLEVEPSSATQFIVTVHW